MDWIINVPRRIKRFLKKLPNKKHHLDFLIAILSVPVLTLAVYTSVSNIQKNNKLSPTPMPVKTVEKPIIIEKNEPNNNNLTPTSTPGCQKQVGPISISFPSENQIVKDNPVCITIKYDDSKYCSVVWSYRINGGSWSDYNSSSVCLYDVPRGSVKFDLRVQSTVSQDQTELTRNFEYEGTSNATSSATLQ